MMPWSPAVTAVTNPRTESSESAAQMVEKDLRRAIIELELPPGARLSETEIALKHGVSRQPVREALIRLAEAGFVEVQPQRGTRVVKISASEMQEALFVRHAVEVAVAERAAGHFDAWQRRRLDTILARQDDAAARVDHALFREQDELFHLAIAQGAGAGIAWSSIIALKAHMDRVCNLTLQNREDLERRVREHREIVAAIDAKDGPRAAKAMSSHLESILDQLPELESRYAELFA
jgi:GntR family transcriptional regulator, rspAB operon transcriptional repressor